MALLLEENYHLFGVAKTLNLFFLAAINYLIHVERTIYGRGQLCGACKIGVSN